MQIPNENFFKTFTQQQNISFLDYEVVLFKY